MLTSGTAPISTTDDNPVDVIATITDTFKYQSVSIVNEGAAAGFFSLDGGNTWARLPAASDITLDRVVVSGVKVKRTAGGTNLSGVYAAAWRLA